MLIAKSRLFAKCGARPRVPLLIGIEAPARRIDGVPACRVHLRGISRPRDIYGEDSMQALALALAFLHMELARMRDDGWVFYSGAKDRKAIDLLSIWYPRWASKRRRTTRNIRNSKPRRKGDA